MNAVLHPRMASPRVLCSQAQKKQTTYIDEKNKLNRVSHANSKSTHSGRSSCSRGAFLVCREDRPGTPQKYELPASQPKTCVRGSWERLAGRARTRRQLAAQQTGSKIYRGELVRPLHIAPKSSKENRPATVARISRPRIPKNPT